MAILKDTATFSLLPEQYDALLMAMKENSQVSNFVPVEADGRCSGVATLENLVDVSWTYDGNSLLTVTILSKHGEAKLLPDSAIFGHIQARLNIP